jgi:hypothetical protein
VSATITYRLREFGEHTTLDGYLFGDEDHAIEWLNQEYIKSEWPNYLVEKVKVREATCKHCGSDFKEIEVICDYSVKKFLGIDESSGAK